MVVLGYFLMILIGVMICVKVVEVATDTYSEHEHTGRTYWQSFLEVIGWYEMTENVEKIFGEKDYIPIKLMVGGKVGGITYYYMKSPTLDVDRVKKDIDKLIKSYNEIHTDEIIQFSYELLSVDSEPIDEFIVIGITESQLESGEEEIKTRVFIDGELYSEGIEVERILPIITDEYLAEGKELECCPRVVGGTDYYFCSKDIEKPEKFTTKDVLKQVKADQINHPKHYTQGSIECLDAIKESLTQEGYKGYLKGNIMKYLWRYEYKNGYEDLGKANFYLDKLIKENDID